MKPGSRAQPVVEVTAEELDGFVVAGPTADECSRTYDGRVLDTREKVLAFLAELEPTETADPRTAVG